MTNKTRIIMTVTAGVLLAAGVLILRNKKAALAEATPMKSYAMIVSSEMTKKEDVSLSLPYLAIVQSDKSVVLSSRIAARVLSIVTCGNTVHKGDILIKLDARELKAKKEALNLQIVSIKSDLGAKKVLLETTQASHRRTKALLAVKGASRESYDKEVSAISGLNAAIVSLQNRIGIVQSNISEIDTSLSYAVLRSPIDGIASQCFANVGDISMPGKPLVNIESKNGKYLLVRSADNVKPKALRYKGETYALTPMQNTYNGLNEYRAYLPTIRSSGERVTVSLLTYVGEGVKLPLGALLEKEYKTYAFVVHKDRAEAVELKVIAKGEEGVVVEGLKEGVEIVVAKPDILLKLLAGVPLLVRNK